MWMQGPQVISLALTGYEQWHAARGASGTSDGTEQWLTWFAMVALVLAVILSFWAYVKRKRIEDSLRSNITNLTVNTVKLRQEKGELAAANKKLQQAIAELSQGQAAILQNMKSQ